jgi:hypothetical protein
MATTASTVIQPTVSHSSLKASRIKACLSAGCPGRAGKTSGGGAQHSSAQTPVFTVSISLTDHFLPSA